MPVKRPFPAYLLLLLADPKVSRRKKVLFPLLVLVYWIMPDLMPFFPLDDLLFTLLMTFLFTRSAERDVAGDSKEDLKGKKTGATKMNGKEPYVDVQGKVVDDEDNDY